MRLVIDMQGAQSIGNRHRGIGRYTVSLVKALISQKADHEVLLAVNGAFPETVDALKADFKDLISPDAIKVWWPTRPCRAIESANDKNRLVAEASIEAFIASLKPDVVLISSLFEGLVDDAAVSVGRLGRCAPVATILYDLIPLIHSKTYLQNPDMKRWYQQRLDHLSRSDLLLAISRSSAQEAVDHLNFPENAIVNIGTACGEEFRPIAVGKGDREYLLKNYGIRNGFVLYTGGIDHRKNIEKLIEAYSMLSNVIRTNHQLVIVCSVHQADRERLEILAYNLGLSKGQFILTGFVPDQDLLKIYNSCDLFVFPSWHEGFGLPALEAMSCGRPTIGSNTSSIPEVLGVSEAQFDPYDVKSISSKIAEVLTDETLRMRLQSHASYQAKKFSWSLTSKLAWEGLERLFIENMVSDKALPLRRPKLAMVSPVRDARSGIADYVSELLPQLAKFYDIHIIAEQVEDVTDQWIMANSSVESVEEFKKNHRNYDRIVYHFGNSHFHAHMFDLLKEIPGVVVLHDFFLSGIVAHMDVTGDAPGCWPRALLADHGWNAAKARFEAYDTADVVWAYPCNGDVLRYARGLIVHAEHSVELAQKWYPVEATSDWAVIPHLRVPVIMSSATARAKAREEARRQLGVSTDDFVVCSFGHMGLTKLNHRLLAAWKAAGFHRVTTNRLVFAGQNESGGYGQRLAHEIGKLDGQVLITGFLNTEEYRLWLLAADIAVQLRTNSRGETSGAVLDCWNYGLATIVNAHGGMANLPQEAVLRVPDLFTDADLVDALRLLHSDNRLRNCISDCGRSQILKNQSPSKCSAQYRQAIERFYSLSYSAAELLQEYVSSTKLISEKNVVEVVKTIAMNFPPKARSTQWLIDVSELVRIDSKSGIQRVVRAILRQLLNNPPPGVIVRPVYARADEAGYLYADRFTAQFLGINDSWCEDSSIEASAGDVFLALDLQPHILPHQTVQLQQLRTSGVRTFAVVYDLLPITLPHTFVDGAAEGHCKWLDAVQTLDGAICISRSVADDLATWLHANGDRTRKSDFVLHHFPLGADINESVPTLGRPVDADALVAKLSGASTFIAVGTIEPRKGHELILNAFEDLWHKGRDYILLFVGKQGWLVERLVDRIRGHQEFGHRLIWLEAVSDEYLAELYRASSYLIAASLGEGFGLPLIEAAMHDTPVIARDIPVFREIGSDCTTFFPQDASAEVLAEVVDEAAAKNDRVRHSYADWGAKFTWQASADALKSILTGLQEPYFSWPSERSVPDGEKSHFARSK